jgi:hypothetical protein
MTFTTSRATQMNNQYSGPLLMNLSEFLWQSGGKTGFIILIDESAPKPVEFLLYGIHLQ